MAGYPVRGGILMSLAKYLWAKPLVIKDQFAVVASTNSPYIQVYPWTDGEGFGSKLANPSVLPPGEAEKAVFSKAGDAIAVALNNSAVANVYEFSKDSGIGAKYGNPSTPFVGNASRTIAFSPDGSKIVIATNSASERLLVYEWDSSTGFGTKLSGPPVQPTGIVNGITFSPDGSLIAIAHQSLPYVTVYQWSSSGFGPKLANPDPAVATATNLQGLDVHFNPEGTHLAVSNTSFSPHVAISVFPISSSGFGAKQTSPTVFGNATGVRFSPKGDAIALALEGGEKLMAWEWSPVGFGTQYAQPVASFGTGYGLDFSPSGKTIALVQSSSPEISAFPWSDVGGFGTVFAGPATQPAGTPNWIDFTAI